MQTVCITNHRNNRAFHVKQQDGLWVVKGELLDICKCESEYIAHQIAVARNEHQRLKDIIYRAKVRFHQDGPDGVTAAAMLEILSEVKDDMPNVR